MVDCRAAPLRSRFCILAGTFVVLSACWGFQRPFREYPGQEYTGFEVPPGANEKTEFVMGRLMFPASPYGMFGRLDQYYDWRTGHTGWEPTIIRARTVICRAGGTAADAHPFAVDGTANQSG